jgi:hypothetical protein
MRSGSLKRMVSQQATVCFCSTVQAYIFVLLCSEIKLEEPAILQYIPTQSSQA